MPSKQDPVRAVEDERGLRPTLTEAEHDAIEFAVETGRVAIHDDAILRNLLERTNHDAAPAARAAEPESSVPPGSVAAPANTHTLTDEEREAVLFCISCAQDYRETLWNTVDDWEQAWDRATRNIDIAIRLTIPFATLERTRESHATRGTGGDQ